VDSRVGVSAKNLFYSPTHPIDYSDIAPDRHGTFNYTETVNSYFGPLDPADVYIARAAVPTPTIAQPNAFRLFMPAIFNSFKKLNERRTALGDPPTLPTWVVNLSVYGKVDKQHSYASGVIPHDAILFVAAAGNDHTENDLDTKIYTQFEDNNNVLIVGALDSSGKVVAGYSNHSHHFVDIFAQGSCLCANAIKVDPSQADTRNQLNGTSQAAPVAAVAAKMLAERFSPWRAEEIKWRLISTSDIPANLEAKGRGGSLNILRALQNSFGKTRILTTSNDESEIDYINPSNPLWHKLLQPDGNFEVLRVHRISSCLETDAECKEKNCADQKVACFRLMHRREGFSDYIVAFSADDKLQASKDGQTVAFSAGDINDIFQPVLKN
jgi:Subtilase family